MRRACSKLSILLSIHRWRSATMTLLVALLAGCGGSSNTPPPPPPGPLTVTGSLSFEFPLPLTNCDGLGLANPERRPIRGATVELINATNNARLDATTSDESGLYSLTATGVENAFVRVRSELKRAGSPGWDVEVRSNTQSTSSPLAQRPLYFLDSAPFAANAGNVTQDLLATTGWDGSRFAGVRSAAPFAVLDVVYTMMQRVVAEGDAGATFPPLDVFWSADNRTSVGGGNLLANIDAGSIGTTFYLGGSIGSLFLLGEDQVDIDEFDASIIAHEWGHYFEDRFSRTDSVGGQHAFGDRLDMRLAFGEGFGNAIAGIGLNDPQYCDTLWVGGNLRGFGFDLESFTTGLPGWFNEFTIAGLLYDLWDGDNDGADTMSIGFLPMFDVLTGPQRTGPALTSAFSFFAALKSQPGAETAYIDGLLDAALITADGIDAFAISETNDAGASPDVLPIYTDITLNGTQQVCVNSQFDSGRFGNKLSQFRYLRLDLTAAGPISIAVDTVDPPSQPSPGFNCTASATDPENSTHSDPDFQLFRNGQLVSSAIGCGPNRETATTTALVPGTYVLDLNERRHADPATNTPGGFPGQICFDVSIVQ